MILVSAIDAITHNATAFQLQSFKVVGFSEFYNTRVCERFTGGIKPPGENKKNTLAIVFILYMAGRSPTVLTN